MAKGFSDTVTAWRQKVEAALLDTFKEAFVEIGSRVIDRTPVDTGRAQGSWQSDKNGFPGGKAPNRDAETAKAELREIAAGLKLGDVATLSSTLHYIHALEYGRSDQAPHGMLRLTAQQWEEIITEAMAKAKAKHGLK